MIGSLLDVRPLHDLFLFIIECFTYTDLPIKMIALKSNSQVKCTLSSTLLQSIKLQNDLCSNIFMEMLNSENILPQNK